MMDPQTPESDFARLVEALEPYLPDLVFVGGWAHRLHALHELAYPQPFPPLMTRDADIALRPPLRARHPDMRTLLTQAGFYEEPRGEDVPPMTQYRLQGGNGGFSVEFLAHQTGSGYRRNGERDDTTLVAGATAQKLRFVDLLAVEPWQVRLHEGNGFPVKEAGVEVQVANPVTFMAQKILTWRQRHPEHQPKDLLYVHDTVLRFTRALPSLSELWQQCSPSLSAKALSDLRKEREALFSEVNDRIRKAVQIARMTGRPSPPGEDRFLQVCRAGLAEIFGPAS